MKIIDTHTHLDASNFNNALDASNFLSKETSRCGFYKSFVLQLLVQKWTREEIGDLINEYKNLIFFVDINPFEENSKKKLKKFINNYGYFGLKLHPRLNKFNILDKKTIDLVNLAGDLNVPVIIDCFPDGNSIIENFNPTAFGKLANYCKNTNIIAAHMGGIYALEMMLIVKRCPNLYLNLAYSLLYFRNSSITADIIYCINSLRGEKIFYGSDYPDRDLQKSLDLSLIEFKKFNLSKDYLKKILYDNSYEFLDLYA